MIRRSPVVFAAWVFAASAFALALDVRAAEAPPHDAPIDDDVEPDVAPQPDVAPEPETETETAVRIEVVAPTHDAEPPPTPASEKKTNVTFEGAPGKGLTVKVGDAFSLNIRSRIQIRYQLDVPPPSADSNTRQLVNIGTARLWFSGHIFKPQLTYMIQLAVAARDFRDGATSPIYDAFLDWVIHRDFGLRGGQYFVPFDRLRTIREFALQMADRPRPVAELTLDRDVGITVYSDEFLHDESPVAYRVGAFGGGGTNLTVGKDPGALVVGRVEVRPLGPIDDDQEGDLERRQRPAIALGGGIAANWATNRLRSTTGPTFVGGTTHYYHGAADLVFKWWGWAVQAEYLRKVASRNRIESVDDMGDPLVEYTRQGQGWVVQTSYVLDPPIEIVGRLARLYTLGPTDPTFIDEVAARGQEVGGGINYYFNGHRMKLQADWIGLMPGNFDFGDASHGVHLQLDVTF